MVMQSKVPCGERQALRIRLDVTYVANHPVVSQTITAAPEHGGVDVGEDDESSLAHLAREAGSEISCPTRNVQGALPGPKIRQRQRETFPEPMRPG